MFYNFELNEHELLNLTSYIADITRDCLSYKTIYTSTIQTCRDLLNDMLYYYDEHAKEIETADKN